MTWETKPFWCTAGSYTFRFFCSDRFCYSCVSWTWLYTMSCLESQLCQISVLLDLHLPYHPWPRCQMELDMVCRLVPLWHEGVRCKKVRLEAKAAVSVLSAGETWVLAVQQQPRISMFTKEQDGWTPYSDFQCCRLTAWASSSLQ